MRIHTVDIIHNHPLVLTNAFPHVWCLTASVLAINLLRMIVVEMVNFITNHVFDTTGILLCYIRHKIATIRHGTDVGIKYLYLFVRILKKQLGLSFQCCKLLIGITIIQLCTSTSILTYSKVDHRLTYSGIPDGLWSPRTTYLSKLLWKQLINTCLMVGPMYEIVTGHQHQPTIVSPTKFVGTLPLCGA